MWVWQECEDYESFVGEIAVVDDWGAAAQRYLEIGPRSSAAFEIAVEGDGPWTISLRYRRTEETPAIISINAGGESETVELAPTGDRKLWGWVTVPAHAIDGKVRIELRASNKPCQVDGFFVHDEPLEPPDRVEQLNEMAGAAEAKSLSERPPRTCLQVGFDAPKMKAAAPFASDIARDAAGDWWPALESLAAKPCPYIVNAYDVGVGTDYNSDYSWHALDKEKLWMLPWSGSIGLVNPNSDCAFLLRFGLDGSQVMENFAFRTVVHLADVLVYAIELEPVLRCEVMFRCRDSNTIVASVHIGNSSEQERQVLISHTLVKDPLEDPPPQRYVLPGQKFGAGVETTAGSLAWRGLGADLYNDDVDFLCACFYEWVRGRSRGRRLLATIASAQFPESFEFEEEIDVELPIGFVTGAEHRVTIPANGAATYAVALNMRRITLNDTWQPELTPELYKIETEDEAVKAGYRSCLEALSDDIESAVRASVEPYKRFPKITLPEKSWEADFYACLELIRASTFSPLGNLKTPFYNFCRVHAHEPFNWWSYGMHGHENLITLFANYFAPELSADFLRGHIRHQTPEGKYPYGVSHRTSVRTQTEEATLPLIVWEAWLSYLWSGDREFLWEAYESGKRNADWWLRTRDRCGEGLCHYCNYSWETARDDNGLPTWVVTGGAMYQEALDLNCYLLVQERTLSEMARELGLPDEAKRYAELAARRAKLMNAHMWHEADRCYYGIGEVVPCWANVRDISTFCPLWAKLAPEGRFETIVALLADPETFGTPYGPPTLAKNEPCFGPEKHWYGSNWVEMTMFVTQGLKNYGFYSLAADLARRNTKMVFDVLEREGHFREYFNSVEGNGTDLIDYVWTGMPAHFIVGILLGIEPKADCLEILPALPEGWNEAKIEGLLVRGKRISVSIRRDLQASAAMAAVNGEWAEVADGRGIRLPWDRLDDGLVIEIVQPPAIPETHAAPPEAPADWSDVPPHKYPDDEELIRTVRGEMKEKWECG